AHHGGDPNMAHANDAEDWRRDTAAGDDVYTDYLSCFLLQFCRGAGAVLHCSKPLEHCAILLQQEAARAHPREGESGRETKSQSTLMSTEADPTTNAKELLDTMLGYLGFVVQIEETTNEAGSPTLQIYTEEASRLIRRDGETLDAIQCLLNRLLQATGAAA